MNWQEYQEWLAENILQKQEVSEEDNDENETNPYTLRPEAKTKYLISNEKEVITALTNLITSIENNQSYSLSYSNQEESDYHSLPTLTDLVDQKNQAITWNQLFPNRTEAFFGAKDNNQPLNPTTFATLAKIFNDWVEETTRVERLTNALSEKKAMGEFLLEAAVSLNYDLIKRKGYDRRLKAWVQEYEKLSQAEKTQLAEQKAVVDKLLSALAEESANHSTRTTPEPVNSSWNWTQIAQYSLIGLVILLGFGLFLRLIKGGKD